MSEANKTALAHFTETETWSLLRPINTAVVEPHNEFTGAGEPTVPNYSDIQVPVKHDFSETFERKKFDGNFLIKVSFIILALGTKAPRVNDDALQTGGASAMQLNHDN